MGRSAGRCSSARFSPCCNGFSASELVEEVRLFPANPLTGERGALVERVEMAPNALVFSHQHQVRWSHEPRRAFPACPAAHPLGELLPAMYAGDDFAQRFTAGLDSVSPPFCPLWTTCRPTSIQSWRRRTSLSWLASWVAVELDPGWPVPLRRAVVARALELHRWRGTAHGLVDAAGALPGGARGGAGRSGRHVVAHPRNRPAWRPNQHGRRAGMARPVGRGRPGPGDRPGCRSLSDPCHLHHRRADRTTPELIMRSCQQCGAQAHDTDDFCGNCGTYLGWVEAQAKEPAREPETDDLGAVLPGKPVARRPLPTTQAKAAVDGPPCPACGTTNSPDRSFCRHCGAQLTPTAQSPARLRRRFHWRRWFGRGDSGKWLRRLAVLILIVVLVIVGIALFPLGRDLVEDVRDKIADPAPIGAKTTVATAEVPGHPAAAAVDGLSNHYWGVPAVGDSIEFTFAQPFRMLSVVVHSGTSTDREQFAQQARPSAIELVITTSDGQTRTLPITLADQSGPQRTNTGISDVVRVRLVVRAAAGLTEGKHIALGEVEFFRRS